MTITLNAVFQGGGVKGIGLVGALARVEEEGVKFVGLAGTSAGAIVAALYAGGYNSKELKDLLMKTNFGDLLDPGWWPGFVQLWKRYGIHRGQLFYEWIFKLLRDKGVETFEDLRDYDLKIIASDIRHKRILLLDREHHPTLEIAEAVRMSIGIPFFFEAFRFGQSLVVDGGLLSNYPLWVFETSKESTLGFKLVSKASRSVPRAPDSFPQYLASLVSTMLEAHDKEDERTSAWARTIHIPTFDVVTTDFGLKEERKELLYLSGYNAASDYIKANKGKLTPPAPTQTQAGTPYESLERLKNLPDGYKDRVFSPLEVRRFISIDQPNAEMEVVESLVNASNQSQYQVMRYIATDTRTDIKDLDFKAWITLDGKKQAASAEVESSPDRRTFKIRIGFRGWIVKSGERVELRWKTKAPGSVPLNEDYWVFGLQYFERRPERFFMEASFKKVPVDLLFLAISGTALMPLSISGPDPKPAETNGGKSTYVYSTMVDAPGEYYVLRWQLE